MADQDVFTAHQYYHALQHNLPVKTVLPAEDFIDKKNPYYPLFLALYHKIESFYEHLPQRKNGEIPFIHPINVLYALKKAGVEDELAYCVALLHDYVEEMVDIYEKKLKSQKTGDLLKILGDYELKVVEALRKELAALCDENNLDEKKVVDGIVNAVCILTRHKRHFYLKSLSSIFNYSGDPQVKERAIQVKLADRTHNVMSISFLEEQGRLYQCYKSLFILNNVKKYLLDTYGKEVFTREVDSPTEKLFNKCAKATYDAYQRICGLCSDKGISDVKFIFQLAFKKYMLSRGGIAAVTEPDPQETHPMRLFQGVVQKYDARLHKETERFEELKAREVAYVKEFFQDCDFTGEQLRAVLDYKDAYSIKEVVAHIIYEPEFYLSRFLSEELDDLGRIC